MMSSSPRVSVVMAAYNAAEYLHESISSILRQTFRDFEFIIINDGSTDGTREILHSYRRKDSRVLVHDQPNEGVGVVRNMSFRLSRGEYLVTADDDDISLPQRLARQVAFMDTHPDVGVCGAWVRTWDGLQRAVCKYPTEDAAIRSELIFRAALANPAVILRKASFVRAGLWYDPHYKTALDYELWVRSSEYVTLANIPEILVLYRRHPKQLSQVTHSDELRVQLRRIWQGQFQQLGIEPADADWNLHEAISAWNCPADQEAVQQAGRWLDKLRAANARARVYPEPAFSQMLGRHWYSVCTRAARSGKWAWEEFWRSSLGEMAGLSRPQRLRFRIKCFLGKVAESLKHSAQKKRQP